MLLVDVDSGVEVVLLVVVGERVVLFVAVVDGAEEVLLVIVAD